MKIVPLSTIVTTGLASIVIYRVLQFIFKAIEILSFFGSMGPVYWFYYCVVNNPNKGFPLKPGLILTQRTQKQYKNNNIKKNGDVAATQSQRAKLAYYEEDIPGQKYEATRFRFRFRFIDNKRQIPRKAGNRLLMDWPTKKHKNIRTSFPQAMIEQRKLLARVRGHRDVKRWETS